MVIGMTPFTFAHVVLSLIGILTGFVVLWGLLKSKRLDGWTAVFLATTVATSVTGFFFPFERLLPSHIVGVVSLVVLAVATFTVTLSAASAQMITVAYATADEAATAGNDYQAASGTLTFAPGETSKTIPVPVNGDRLGEPNETFVVNLSGATNATIAVGQGVGTITDDEPRIDISDVSKKEGKKGQTTLFVFTVTLSAAYDQPVTMSYRTADGTAKTSDSDYAAKSGTLTFAPGQTTKAITIEVKGDSKKEADETFYLDLFGNGSNSLFTKNRDLGTILNDDWMIDSPPPARRGSGSWN